MQEINYLFKINSESRLKSKLGLKIKILREQFRIAQGELAKAIGLKRRQFINKLELHADEIKKGIKYEQLKNIFKYFSRKMKVQLSLTDVLREIVESKDKL